MIALDLVHRIKRAAIFAACFTVAAYLLGYYAIPFLVAEAPYVGTLIVGWMLGVLTVAAIKEHDYRRRTRSLDVVGRDYPALRVVRERAPVGPAVPTKWRNERGHRRYGVERDGGAE